MNRVCTSAMGIALWATAALCSSFPTPPAVLDFEPDRWLRIESSSSSKPGAGETAIAATSPLRQSFDMRVPVPPTPVTVAGTPQLVYELHLTNFAREPLVLQRVEVLDADDAEVIADLHHDALDHRLDRPGAASTDASPRTIASGMGAVLYLELPMEEGIVPDALEHRIAYHVAQEDPPQLAFVQGAHVRVQTNSPVVLAPPLRGGPWAAIYFSSWHPVHSHRRVFYAVDGRARIPGRFAIDWVLLDADGRRADGDQDDVANWYGYGVDVLAVADGVVVATRDDVAESATLSDHPRHPLEDATGNYVTLDLGGGRYAAYEHLEPGSVRVTVGEHVRRGQVIGSIGFTGHSMGPHLHFHVADANSPLGAEGLPFVLDEFTVLGSYDDFAALDNVPWSPLDEADRARRTEELPGPNVVVEFAGSDRLVEPAPNLNPDQIRSGMLVWRIGVNSEDGPSAMVETITRTTYQGRPTWRVTHYDQDPASTKANSFDLYDLDRKTLAPIRSVMRNETFDLDLVFTPQEVTLRRVAKDGSKLDERIALQTAVQGEGPGLRVLIASLPLRPGFKFRYHQVDRWGGEGDSRVKPMTISVVGQTRVQTAFGAQDALEVVIEPDDKSFRIRSHVRAKPPYYPYKVEYVRGEMTVVSEVTAMAFEGGND